MQERKASGRQLSPADPISLLHVSHSSLCGFRVAVDTALERAEVGLSDGESTVLWKSRSVECLTFNNELDDSGKTL